MPAGTGEHRQLQLFTIFYIKKQSVHYRILRSYKDTLHGPSGGSRTHGLMDPNHARYQLRYTRKQLIYYKRNFIRCQDIRQKKLAQKIKEFFGIQKETPLKGCSLRDFTPWKNIGIVWSDPAMPIFLSLGAVRLLQ